MQSFIFSSITVVQYDNNVHCNHPNIHLSLIYAPLISVNDWKELQNVLLLPSNGPYHLGVAYLYLDPQLCCRTVRIIICLSQNNNFVISFYHRPIEIYRPIYHVHTV